MAKPYDLGTAKKKIFSEQQIDHKIFQNNKFATNFFSKTTNRPPKFSQNNNSTTIFLGAAKKKLKKNFFDFQNLCTIIISRALLPTSPLPLLFFPPLFSFHLIGFCPKNGPFFSRLQVEKKRIFCSSIQSSASDPDVGESPLFRLQTFSKIGFRPVF